MSEVSESVGRYVSAIHLLTAGTDRRAGTGELAEVLDVSAASVTEMVTSLDDRGLATYEKYDGVVLTEAGEEAAREFRWRRCVAENFLEGDLGLDPAAFGDDADDPRALGLALPEAAVHRLKEIVDHPCDGACNAPRDEYTACSEEVRETVERADVGHTDGSSENADAES